MIERLLGKQNNFGIKLDSGNIESWLAEDRHRVQTLLNTPSPLVREVDDLLAHHDEIRRIANDGLYPLRGDIGRRFNHAAPTLTVVPTTLTAAFGLGNDSTAWAEQGQHGKEHNPWVHAMNGYDLNRACPQLACEVSSSAWIPPRVKLSWTATAARTARLAAMTK